MSAPARIRLRIADASYAPRLHALVAANGEERRLHPRALREIAVQAERFIEAPTGQTILRRSEPRIVPADVVSADQS